MHPCPVSLNEDAACDCDSGLSLCLRYLPISGSSADSPLYLFLRTFPVPSRLLAASRPPLLVVFVLEPAARPFAPNPLLAALCPRLHVNPSLLSPIIAEARFLNIIRLHMLDISGSGLANDSRSCTFSTRHVHPCSEGCPRYYRLIPALAYEHRAARYPGYTNIDTTGTWSKYPGRPWRESYTGCWAFVKRPPCAVYSLP